jgi:hypothetical protein
MRSFGLSRLSANMAVAARVLRANLPKKWAGSSGIRKYGDQQAVEMILHHMSTLEKRCAAHMA